MKERTEVARRAKTEKRRYIMAAEGWWVVCLACGCVVVV